MPRKPSPARAFMRPCAYCGDFFVSAIRPIDERMRCLRGRFATAECARASVKPEPTVQPRPSRPERPRPVLPHGTVGGYTNWRCRCAECTKAHTDYQRDYQRRYRATHPREAT